MHRCKIKCDRPVNDGLIESQTKMVPLKVRRTTVRATPEDFTASLFSSRLMTAPSRAIQPLRDVHCLLQWPKTHWSPRWTFFLKSNKACSSSKASPIVNVCEVKAVRLDYLSVALHSSIQQAWRFSRSFPRSCNKCFCAAYGTHRHIARSWVFSSVSLTFSCPVYIPWRHRRYQLNFVSQLTEPVFCRERFSLCHR